MPGEERAGGTGVIDSNGSSELKEGVWVQLTEGLCVGGRAHS